MLENILTNVKIIIFLSSMMVSGAIGIQQSITEMNLENKIASKNAAYATIKTELGRMQMEIARYKNTISVLENKKPIVVEKIHEVVVPEIVLQKMELTHEESTRIARDKYPKILRDFMDSTRTKRHGGYYRLPTTIK